MIKFEINLKLFDVFHSLPWKFSLSCFASPLESCHYYPLLLLKHKFQNSHKALHFISFYFLQNWIQLLKALRSKVFSTFSFWSVLFCECLCVCVCLCKHGCGGFYLNGYDLKWVVFATDLCDNKYTKYIYYRRAYMDRDKKMRLHALQIHTNCIR